MGKLDKKVAVITGGARGIGRQMALSCAGEGADIVIADIIDMEEVKHEVARLGRRIVTVKADMSKVAEIRGMVEEAIGSFGKIDILINDAAVTYGEVPLINVSEDNWDTTMDINLKGYFFCIQAVAKYMMEKQYGKIINIASVRGLNTFMRNAMHNYTYTTAKAGVIWLTKLCARELGRQGINVNCIAPGLVLTEIVTIGRTQEQIQAFTEAAASQAPLGRIGNTLDIAGLAVFLASDDSSYITGQIISADGGWAV